MGSRMNKSFAVSCQIFFSDPEQASRRNRADGRLVAAGQRCACAIASEPDIRELYPCFYGGGGSCAFDRQKVSGAGRLRRAARAVLSGRHRPRLSWRGSAAGRSCISRPAWCITNIAEPSASASATRTSKASSRRTFCCSPGRTSTTWRRLMAHFFFTWADAMLSWLFGDSPERASFAGIARATLQLAGSDGFAMAGATAGARSRDTEAFRRPLGGSFPRHVCAMPDPNREPLRVLFVSPYPICPPVHGGGVFMYQTVRELARLCELHLIVLLDLAASARGTRGARRRSAHRSNTWCGWRAGRRPSGPSNRMRFANFATATWRG